MKNLYKNIFLFIVFSLWGLGGFGWGAYAQLYPVNLTPIFNVPYSVKISEYANSMDTKMQLLINPTDFAITQKQVRLKLYIQGNRLNIQSSDYIQGQRPIFINGGELQTLTNNDIAALFRLENLQGITAAQYAAPLPDGMYNFCFEMYDFLTNEKLSQKSCGMMYLQLNDPPILNIPAKNEQIVATDFPNILFNWTPRQINATNVSYKFELKQIIDPTLDPQIGFMMAPLLHEETVFSTALLYNLSMPILTPGMRYAWRVKAISTTGLSENAVFKNDGYSEIFSFKYATNCSAPNFLLSQAQSAKSAKITWQSQSGNRKFHVQYRTKGVAKAEWFSVYTQNDQVTLTNLEPELSYEFRVGATCEAEQYGIDPSYVYSNIQEFRMPDKSNAVQAYNCGIRPALKISNQTPLTNLIQSETFTAGDFPVTILELSGKSPYSGLGYVVVPYLADTKIAVEFNNIIINTDYQLINGIVETSYNPDWNNVADVEDHTGEGARGQIQEAVPFVISDIVINANGDIVVNGTNGEQVIIPGGKDTSITDGNGTVYHVDKNGNGSNQGDEAAKGGKSTPANTDGVDKNGQVTAFTAKGVKVEFTESNSTKYAFDVMPKKATAALEKLYRKVGDVALPYKAVVNGQSDTVLATVTITDTIVKPENIVFKTQSGAKVDFNRNNNVFTLTVKGNQTYAEEQIIATILQGDKWKVIGAFELVHISPKEVNVALVPTDKTAQDKLGAIIKKTQEIYDKVGIKINFTTAAILDISDITGDKIKTEKNTLTSTYSTEQQKINDRYQGSEDSYVLFVTEKASSTGQAGYMRLNGKFGYVFAPPSGGGGLKIAAHELGHGIFKLEHPFELYKTTEKGTDLLMDYSEGIVLNHQDWKQINDPGFRLYAFQSQASGESTVLKGITDDLVSQLTALPTSNNECLSFAVGNGKFVKFDQSTFSNFDKINIVDGVLKSIYIKENNSLGKAGGQYTFIMNYKAGKSVQNGKVYEVISTSDLVCAECIRNDKGIAKETAKDLDNQKITVWSANSDIIKKYTLVSEDKYKNCSSGMCVTIGIENNGYKTKILSEKDCEQYIKDNKLFGSNVEVCDATRYTATIDPKHLKDIKDKINSVKSLSSSIDTPLSTKKYVHKLGNFKLEREDLLNVLEDRFRMLYETTKNNIYFVPLSMAIQADGKQYFYDKETLDRLTKEVFESCGLGSNDILLVLPFNDMKDTKCLPLGIAKKGSTVLSDDEISGLTGNWDKKVLQLFSKVAKPLTVSTYYITATNKIIRFNKKTSDNVKGYSAIKVLQFFKSKAYAEINELNKELNRCTDPQQAGVVSCRDVWTLYEPFLKRENAIFFKYSNLELASGGMQSKDIWDEISTDDIGKLREPFMDQKAVTDQIFIDSKVKWAWYAQVEISLENSELNAKKHFYDFNKLTVLDDIVYSTLDAVGTIPGFDTVSDPFGAIYAGVRGDKGNAVIYSASFMIPLAGSAYIKGGLHEAKQAGELWGIVAKKADNADGFILDVKKISDIKADEFHVSSLSYGNVKELAEKVKTEALIDASIFIDEKNIKNALNELADNLGSLLSKIDNLPNLSAAEKKALKADLNKTEELKNLFAKNAHQTDELARAWKNLKEANRSELRKDAKALESFVKLKKNPSFSKMGLTDELISSLQGYGNTTRSASFSEILNDLDKLGDFLHSNSGTTFENFDKVLGILKRTDEVGNNYKQGVHWMIRDLNTTGEIFAGKKIKFEHSIPNARPTAANSSIDALCINCGGFDKDIMVEYKSGPGSISTSTIKDQFIERDLFNANSLDQIQWRMEGTGMTADKLKTWMKENRVSIDQLINSDDLDISAKFKRWYNVSNLSTSVSDLQIDNFVNKNFNEIFK
ncbi:hypothetical protein B4N84_10765 [Flavobacterium sp. IR1]|nr:hypothetical protein B4N84_10765 [Flavobacterium sp. IR1]